MKMTTAILIASSAVLVFTSYLCSMLHRERMEKLRIEMQQIVLNLEQLNQVEDAKAKTFWRK